MKVKRLIELLKKCNPDSQVEISCEFEEKPEAVISCAQVGEIVVIGHSLGADET